MAGAREAHYLFFLGIIAGGVTIGVYLIGLLRSIAVPFAFALPVILAVSVYLAFQLARAGETTAEHKLLLAGMAFIMGGAAFDIVATIYHTGDLSNEANPIARTLLDSGYGVPLVYAVGGLCQGLYILLLCLLWTGLLRHQGFLLKSLRDEQSSMTFLKAATGGHKLTWRQWLLPLHLSDMPDARFGVWVFAVILLAASANRWYLGLEWFGFAPGWHLHVGLGAILVGLCVYFIWLWRASRMLVTT
jgi:hypothetical protein